MTPPDTSAQDHPTSARSTPASEPAPAPGEPTFDPDQWLAHYDDVWGRIAHLYPPDAKIGLWFGKGNGTALVPLTDPGAVWDELATHSNADGSYIGMTPRKPTTPQGSYGRAKDCYPASMLWADIDVDKPGYPDSAGALALIASLPLEPHALICSGRGFHACWLLNQLLQSPEELTLPHHFERMLLAAATAAGVAMDKGVTTTPQRVLRPAGTLHRKDRTHPLPVSVVATSTRPLYTVAEVFAVCPAIGPARPARVPGAAPLPGDVLAGELPVTEVLIGLGWTPLSADPTDSHWEAHCDEAESTDNATTFFKDDEQKVILYSCTTATVNGVPSHTPLTSFDWLAARCGGDDADYSLATKLAVRYAGHPDKVLALILDPPDLVTLADIARQASLDWPEGLTAFDAAYLRFRGVAPDVAMARGYQSVVTPFVGYNGAPAPIHGLLVPSAGSNPSSTIRVTKAPVPSDKKTPAPVSLKSDAFHSWDMDICPATDDLIQDATVPLVVFASDRNEFPDSIVADAVASAARREGGLVAAVAVTNWAATICLASALVNPDRADVLDTPWNSVQLADRDVFLAGRAGWRQQPGLVQIADLLEARGAVVSVIDVCDARDATRVTLDHSPWSLGDELAAAVTPTPLADALAAAIPLEVARPQCDTYDANDIGRGRRLASELDRLDAYRYDVDGRCWWRNVGTHWVTQPGKGPDELAIDIFSRDATLPSTAQALENAIKVASHQSSIQIDSTVMDTIAADLNVQNGVVDLHTGKLRPRERAEILTSVCTANFDPTATAPLWQKFLNTTFGLDTAPTDSERQDVTDLIAYVQRVAGLACYGGMPYEKVPVWFGLGHNGKSTMADVLSNILGGYSSTADPKILLGQAEPHQIADLRGLRLLLMAETSDGDTLHTASLKRIAGRDDLKGARKYGHSFVFPPTHLPVLLTNHLPRVAATDEATWRRLALVPFTHTVAKSDADPFLERKLLAEADGILAWMVAGAVAVLDPKIQLGSCKIVDQATGHHRQDQNMMWNFLDQCCTVGADRRTKRTEFCGSFRAWQDREMNLRNGWSTQSIVRSLMEADVAVDAIKSHGEWWLVGVALGADERNIEAAIQSADPVPDDLSGLPEAVPSGVIEPDAVPPAAIESEPEPDPIRVPVRELDDDDDGEVEL